MARDAARTLLCASLAAQPLRSCQILPRLPALLAGGLCSPGNPALGEYPSPKPLRRPPPPHCRPRWPRHPPAHQGHLRSLWVNVPSSFAIVDGETGPDNVFAVDPESSFHNHVVWENQAKEYWVARASRSRLEDRTDPWENKG